MPNNDLNRSPPQRDLPPRARNLGRRTLVLVSQKPLHVLIFQPLHQLLLLLFYFLLLILNFSLSAVILNAKCAFNLARSAANGRRGRIVSRGGRRLNLLNIALGGGFLFCICSIDGGCDVGRVVFGRLANC
jgi:hypothetical protein